MGVCCKNHAYGLCGSPGTTCCESTWVSAARITPTVCAAVPEPPAARVQGEFSTSVLLAPIATSRMATALLVTTLRHRRGGSSARQHGARKAASAARTVPTACAAALDPLAARVQGESSTFAHLEVIATMRT